MIDEGLMRNPSDLIRSEDWNRIVNELLSLRADLEKELENLKTYIENMTRSTTLAGLQSPADPKSGNSYNLTGVPPEFDFGVDVMGLISRQFSRGTPGEICKFGLHDAADVLSYWCSASNGGGICLKISLVYNDGSRAASEDLFVHDYSRASPYEGHPYLEFLSSSTNRTMYRYAYTNPHPQKPIRFIIFEATSRECIPRIGNVIHYATRVQPLKTTSPDR